MDGERGKKLTEDGGSNSGRGRKGREMDERIGKGERGEGV